MERNHPLLISPSQSPPFGHLNTELPFFFCPNARMQLDKTHSFKKTKTKIVSLFLKSTEFVWTQKRKAQCQNSWKTSFLAAIGVHFFFNALQCQTRIWKFPNRIMKDNNSSSNPIQYLLLLSINPFWSDIDCKWGPSALCLQLSPKVFWLWQKKAEFSF